MATREYGTDPYGIIERGVPGSKTQEGPSVSIGGVGSPVYDAYSNRTYGTGVGGMMTFPIGKREAPEEKKKAKGGKVKKMASGGSASKRADGIARKGKTKGRMV